MITIAIIGSGNVAQHLVAAFSQNTETAIVQVFSRKNEAFANVNPEKITGNFSDLLPADLYIIAVSDDAIAEVSAQLPFENRLVVHTSGSISIDALHPKNRKGVFYPLQTFTKNKPTDFKVVPICLESQAVDDYLLLERVANSISNTVCNISSEQRKALHVSAVFINNFVNHLYKIGNDICKEHQIPFDILKPLINETALKIATLSPDDAQTGPAKRDDRQTISAHLEFLSHTNQKNIYNILTQSIQNGKNL